MIRPSGLAGRKLVRGGLGIGGGRVVRTDTLAYLKPAFSINRAIEGGRINFGDRF